MILEGIAGRFVQKIQSLTALIPTNLGSLRLAQVEAEGDEMTRAGLRFHFGPAASVTGIAPVQALPTTAAQWLLYNPSPNPVAQFLDELGVLLVSGTAGAGIVLLAAKSYGKYLPTAANIPTANAANMASDNRGLPNKQSQLVIAASQTLANAPLVWSPIAECDSANTAVLSVSCRNRDLRGKLIIQPGSGLALAVVSPAGTTPLYAPFGTFREYAADLE